MFEIGDTIRDKETGELYEVIDTHGSYVEVVKKGFPYTKGKIYIIHYKFFEKVE